MTIRFVCGCGKHLRAREEMAARRVVCPGCGNLVGVPSLKPTHRGTVAAPLTPLERIGHGGNFVPDVQERPAQEGLRVGHGVRSPQLVLAASLAEHEPERIHLGPAAAVERQFARDRP